MTEPSRSINPEKEKRLNAMIAEYLKRKDAGQHVNKDAILQAYPDLADGLRSYFQGEVLIGDNAPALAVTKLGPVPLVSDVRETLQPGAVQSDTASEFRNRRFGRYQILRPLGEGAMGSVFLALDTTLDRQVALKVPKTAGTANAEFMTRFTREAKAAAALKHANICSVYDAGQHEGTAYITMDFIDGVPLSRFIGTEKLKAVDGILQMISIIADAIGHAHNKGVIHRDLKPGNILVDADFKPHVTDFGLARRAGGPADESRITQEGLLIGTPAYMAPEQVKGEQSKVGPQSDIYSLGVILFELLTCRLPFEGKVPEMLAKVLRDAPPVPSRIRKDLTEDVDDLCLKMLQKNPERRFASIPELMAKIEELRKKFREIPAPSSQVTAQQKSPFEIQKAHIELMLKKGQYAAAIQDLEQLAQETSPGAIAAAAWAKARLPIVRKEARALSPAGLQALLQTAQKMFQKSDYVGCAQLIDDIPSLRRTEPMEDLLDRSKKCEAEAEQLLLDIKDQERRKEVDGLEPIVKKLLKLKPGNAYAKRLSEALQSYGKIPATRRKYLYDKGRLQPMPESGFLRQWAVLSCLVGILVFLSAYSYVNFYLKSGNQTLAVHVDDEWLKSEGGEVTLVVDGDNHTITAPSSGGDPVTIVVSPGRHTFSVKHGEAIVHDPREFTIEKDGRKILSITATDVRLETGVPAPRPASESIAQKPTATANDRSIVAASELEIPGGAQVFDGHSYKFYNESLSWSEAKKKCESMGGHLPIVHSTAQNEFLVRMADQNFPVENRNGWESIWLGMSDRDTEGDWRWVDGKPLGYKNWFRQQPNNTEHAEHFGLLWLSNSAGEIPGQWCDQPDHSQKHVMAFICEWDQERAPLSSPPSVASPLLAIAPFDAAEAKKHQEVWASHLGMPVEYANRIGMKLRLIPPGEFMMGSPDHEVGRSESEGPLHRVRLTQPFYAGMTEITQSQWFAVMGTQPWQGQQFTQEGNDYPATFVSWNDAVAFCEKLSAADGVTYRLPTEAEWEFACRAGTSSEYCFGSDVGQLSNFAWTCENSANTAEKYAHIVGMKKANNFGLSDMHGNLYEWCQDLRGNYIGGVDTAINPVNSAAGEYRVTRGGAWDYVPFDGRSAARGSAMPDFSSRRDGFRVVRTVHVADSGPMSVEHSSVSDLDRIAIGKWVPLVDSNTVLADPDKMHFRDGILELDATSLLLPDLNIRNVIVRADVRKSYPNMGLTVRWSIGKEWTQAYAAWFNGTQSNERDRFGIAKAMKSSVALAAGSSGHTFEPDQFVDLAISAIDNEVAVYVEGRKILSAIDGDYESGSIALGTMNGKGIFRNVRYQTLDQEKREPLETPAVSAVNPQPLVAPFDAEHAVKAQAAWAEYLNVPVEFTNAVGMTFRLIPPGEFLMGSTPEQIEAAKPHLHTEQETERPERANSEGPQRMVRLTIPFFLATTEVTQKTFARVVGRNPSAFADVSDGNGGADRTETPVVNVTWLDAGEFCNRLSSHERLDSAYVITQNSITQTGTGGYRLPTEAEWEYACRAGTTTLFWSGDDASSLVKNAWYDANNHENHPRRVATLAANPFGLFDMHGNVWEWVHDGWQANQYEHLPQPIAVDPRSDVADENRRVIRGGSYFMSSSECRSACRDAYHADSHWNDAGFRVAMSVDAVRQLRLTEESASAK